MRLTSGGVVVQHNKMRPEYLLERQIRFCSHPFVKLHGTRHPPPSRHSCITQSQLQNYLLRTIRIIILVAIATVDGIRCQYNHGDSRLLCRSWSILEERVMATAIATIPTLSKSPEKKVEKPKADGFTIKARMKNTAVSQISC